MNHSRTYTYTSSINHTHSPLRGHRTTVFDHSPQRMVTTTRAPNTDIHTSTVISHSPAYRAPRGRADHHVDPLTDSIVSYGVDENGEQIKITSTGILRSPELRTVAEKTSPGRRVTNTLVSSGLGGQFVSSQHHELSPTRQVKETVFRPSPERVYGASRRVTQFSPGRQVTSTFSPGRSGVVTRHYTNAPMPVQRTHHVVSHSSSVRSASVYSSSVASMSPSPARVVTRTQFSPARRPALVTSTFSRSPSPRQVTRTHFSPTQRQVTRTHFSPSRRQVTRTQFSPSRRPGLITSTFTRSPARQATHHITRQYSPARSASSVSIVSHSASPVRMTTAVHTTHSPARMVASRTEVFSPTRSPPRPITTHNYDGRGGTLTTESLPYGGTLVHKTQGGDDVASRVDRMIAGTRAMRTPAKMYEKTIVERSTAGSLNHHHTTVLF
jgi:hypothetical protein